MAGGMHVDDLPRYTVTSTFRTVDFEIQGESTTAPVATALIAGNIYITCTHVNTCMLKCMHVHAYVHARKHACIYTHTHACMHACMHAGRQA